MPVSEDTNVKYVTRNSYRDRKPIGYVTKEPAVDEKNFQRLKYIDYRQEYIVQRPPKHNVRCQMTTKYVIHKPPTRDVGCQITTNYIILLPPGPPDTTPTSPPTPIILPSTPTPTPSPPPTPTPPTPPTPIIPPSPPTPIIPPSPPTPTPSPPPTPTPPSPPYKKDQLVYCIDLRPHVEILEPKPFDIFERRIVPQQKKKIDDYIVTVGGGWNKMNDYMERHEPVKKFVYEREHLKNSNLPEKKKKYYGFESIYKSPRYNRAHRIL